MATLLKELTLAVIKPDLAVNTKLVTRVTKIIEKHGFEILRKKTVRWNKFDAEKFYEVHRGRFFYPRLVEYMSSGPIIAMVLSKHDAIKEWRQLMGPTKTYQTRHVEPSTLRGLFGLTDTRNTTHGSDSLQTAKHEIEFFFPNFNEMTKHGKLKAKNSSNTLGLKNTWEDYYTSQHSSSTDWFVSYEDIESDIAKRMHTFPNSSKILDLGCGNSPLAIEIAQDYPHADVYCGDVSVEALHHMLISASNCKKGLRNLHCIQMDATNLIPVTDLNLIIDKGTTDAIIRQPDGQCLTLNLLKNALRSLCDKGELIQISDEDPDVRMNLLKTATDELDGQFQTSCREIVPIINENSITYFLYSIVKKS